MKAGGGAVDGAFHLVAVLGVAPRSVYKSIPEADCYDHRRDMRTFAGGLPVVAHPPCRAWSAYCGHQAKPLPGEKDLGPLCVGWLRRCGGILEHPAHSRLFAHCGLPRPGEAHGGCWTVEVLQAWWGDTRAKETWLCFFGVSPSDVTFPFRLHDPRGDAARWNVMGSARRSATNIHLARWLVATAARACVLSPDDVRGHHRFSGQSLAGLQGAQKGGGGLGRPVTKQEILK